MPKRKIKKQQLIREIALERIYILFSEAEKCFRKKFDFSKRYVELALKIAKHCNVKIPNELKLKYCKYCKSFLKLGINAKLRITKNYICLTCLECGKTRKLSFKVYSTTS